MPGATGLLQAERLVAGYRPDLPILNGVTAQVAGGELVTVIGPNGAGKSTLIKAVAGLVAISAGRVLYRDVDLSNRPPHALVGAGIGYVPQTGNVFTGLTVHHNLSLAGHTLPARRRAARLRHAYRTYPLLAEKRHAKGATLSGGQRQLLALAMALLTEPGLIMLDEPSAGLAPQAVGEVFRRLRGLADQGVAVLLVEQNARAALAISDRAYVLAEGRNQLEGTGRALLDDPAVGEVYLGARRVQ